MKKILDFPKLRQVYDYDCGANALQGVLDYYGIDVNEGIIMKKAGTNHKGTEISGLKKAAEYFKLKYREGEMTFDDLKKYIDKKIPVIIAIQAWPKEKVNWKTEWSTGHYVVVVGYSKNRIYFEDPYSERRTFLYYSELEERWHHNDAERNKLSHWGMALSRPANSKKLRKKSVEDFWKRKFKPGFYFNKSIHMD